MTPAGPSSLKSLTVGRGIAAMAVLLFHFSWYAGVPVWFGGIFLAGGRGVDLFFLLSGFSLAWGLRPETSWWHYLAARATRIFPLYWVAFFLTSAYAAWRGYLTELTSVEAVRSALLVHPGPWIVPPAGTIPFEIEMYLLFLTALVSHACFLGCALLFWWNPPVYIPPAYALEFTLAAAAAFMMRRGWMLQFPRSVTIAIVIFATLVWVDEGAQVQQAVYRHLPCAVTGALALYALVTDELRYGWPHCPRLLLLLGEASYSIYLTHYYLLMELPRIMPRSAVPVVTTVAGVAFWYSFERPLMAWRRHALGSSRG